MAEAVRFYWRRGERAIPPTVIHEGGHHLFRVCRSLAQANAPEIVQLLEDGRFVSVAWELDGTIAMILCHPNLAKGTADTLFLDTSALPRVVLKLGNWEEAPKIARLLLWAFGSEAGSIEECDEAKHALVKWLVEHGQPQMAAIVKEFLASPFGPPLNELQYLHVLGKKEQIDQFIGEVQRRFEAIGWRRATAYEAKFNRALYRINHSYWISGPGNMPHILLQMNRETERIIHGVLYSLHDLRPGIPDFDSEIKRVVAEVLEPAAVVVGLKITYPSFGRLSTVGYRTEAAMRALQEAGDGQWPFPDALQPLWRKFIIAASREEVSIDPNELADWFKASGWDEKASIALKDRFYADVGVLAELDEERQRA